MALLFYADQQLDSNGDPVGAGSLYIYSNGTTSEATIYSDAALSVSISNPVTLDSGGRCPTNVHVADGVKYTVKLDDSSAAEVWSRDDVIGVSNPFGNGANTLTGAGAVSVITRTTHLVTTEDSAITLADGSEGQRKTVVMKTDGGIATLTPSTSGGNFSTIAFSNAGDSAELIFTDSAWHWLSGTAGVAGGIKDSLSKITKGATSRDTTTTLADDTYLDSFALEANSWYAVEGLLRVISTSATPDFKFALQTDNAFQGGRWTFTNTNANGTVIGDDEVTTTAIITALEANYSHGIHLSGHISTHGTLDCTVDFQWAQGTSDATATTLSAGSWLRFTRL